ncbi:hypothetical protein Zmor_008142 [Zophobas morio]|uniref:Uncharacterized protein n=1 Tax=Zophobas morio TaxID=2755281 RepID=A0AA38J1W3_9CUCU|nr:hypothetical protein Zmor_008142 [Zophobas morio]
MSRRDDDAADPTTRHKQHRFLRDRSIFRGCKIPLQSRTRGAKAGWNRSPSEIDAVSHLRRTSCSTDPRLFSRNRNLIKPGRAANKT